MRFEAIAKYRSFVYNERPTRSRSSQGQIVNVNFYRQVGGGPSTERHSSFENASHKVVNAFKLVVIN